MSKPNVVFLFPDQMRADFLSCYGAEFLSTPHIDSLAGRGARYLNAFSASPVCVPARTALLTGMNAIRNGVANNLGNLRPDYRDAGIRTWPELLAESGYYTAAIGKMHFYPWDDRRGFQYRVAAEDKRWLQVRDDYYHFLKAKGLRKYHGNEHDGYHEGKGAVVSRTPWEYSWDRFVGMEATRFIRQYGGDGPFAMMVGFPGPHCPYDPAEEFLQEVDESKLPEAVPAVEADTARLREANVEGNRRPWNGVDYAAFPTKAKMRVRKHYAALVKQIDHEVGEIIEALKSIDQYENTVIILSSDHGDYLGDHDFIGKASFYEAAIRVPMIVRIPWAKGAAVVDDMVELRDVMATMLGFAGVELPAYADARPMPGLGLRGGRGRERIFGMLADGWMNFDGRFKLHKYATGDEMLYDLENDPHEQRNLAGDPTHAETLRRLDAELSSEVMLSMAQSMHDRLAHSGDMSQDPAFGKEGWSRPWPHPILDAGDSVTPRG